MREIVKQSVLQQVYDAIKDDIISQYYQPGEKLVVRMLCERYGVSDTPIKQGLNRLVSEGLVVAVEGKGLWVRTFTREDLQDLLRTRFMIESYCITTLNRDQDAFRETAARLQLLVREHRAFLDGISGPMSASEYRVHQELDRQFHLTIVQGVGSSHIEQLYRGLQGHIYMSHIYQKRGSGEAEITFGEHRRIWDQLAMENIPGAVQALREHFASLCRDMDIPFCE